MSKSEESNFNLGCLVAACKDVAKKTGKIIKGVYESGDLQVIDKAMGNKVLSKMDESKAENPATVADIWAQKIIVASLTNEFPGLPICGEEGDLKTSEKHILKLNKTFKNEFPKKYHDIKISDLSVWVDPIDGTKEFTQGIVSAVTTLIGIAWRERPIAGVISRPFTGEIVWGIVGLGAFMEQVENSKTISKPLKTKNYQMNNEKESRVICSSRSHFKASMKAYICACKPTGFVRVGGCGGKVMLLIERKADAYVFPSSGTKKWDTCACEAILLSLGGQLTKPDGTLYDYSNTLTKKDYLNEEGFIATLKNSDSYHGSFLKQNIEIEQLDLILFGATGFTGKLAAQYIIENYVLNNKNSSKFKFGFAARNLSKLRTFITSFGKSDDDNLIEKQIQLIECNSSNIDDCEKLTQLTSCIVTTVGPYKLYGENLIKACVKYGVDYVDLTGEFTWVKSMMNKYNDDAIRSGSRIVNFGGVVSCLADSCVYACVNNFMKKEEVKNNENEENDCFLEISSEYIVSGGKMSGGTTQSWVNSIEDSSGVNIYDSYYLNPKKDFNFRKEGLSEKNTLNETALSQKHPSNDKLHSFPWQYSVVDRMVICQTNYLSNYKYGKKAKINLGKGYIKKWIPAMLVSLLLVYGMSLMQFYLFRKFILFLAKILNYFHILPKSGDGPTMEEMLKAKWHAKFIVEKKNKDNKLTQKAVCDAKIYGDAGYYNTSRILVEEGMIFALERRDSKKKIKGGFITPAHAFGDQIIKRLNQLQQFDITFSNVMGNNSSQDSKL